MKSAQARFLILLGLLAVSGCGTPINLFEDQDFAFTRPGDQIVRGTNTVYAIEQRGMWLSQDAIDRGMGARMKR